VLWSLPQKVGAPLVAVLLFLLCAERWEVLGLRKWKGFEKEGCWWDQRLFLLLYEEKWWIVWTLQKWKGDEKERERKDLRGITVVHLFLLPC
jgi:hypothetical protein